jgi:hypothetical protein
VRFKPLLSALLAASTLLACATADDDVESGSQDIVASGGLEKGEVCQPIGTGAACGKGLVCKDNCPPGAMCFVSIFTCQEGEKPEVTVIGKGGVCSPGSKTSRCADGLTCKSNCPPGAFCFAAISVCQDDD